VTATDGWKPMPAEWAKLLIVCNACGETSQKSWAKQGDKGILCKRCHPYTDGYLTLPRLGEANK
jgi:formylmethanofuran dehydrogenase subunit E